MEVIKRDPLHPTRHHVEPPLYGNYASKFRQITNYDRITKLQNTPRSDRSSARQQCGLQQQALKARPISDLRGPKVIALPPFTKTTINLCLEPGQLDPNQRQSGGGSKRGSAWAGPLPLVRLPSYSSSPARSGKKQFHNVMWDPRIARGSTLVRFSEAQRSKCSRELDLNRFMLFREKSKRKHSSAGNLIGRNYPHNVKLSKEPLSYSAFAPFLTENLESTYANRGQSMEEDSAVFPGPEDTKKFGNKYSVGPSKTAQTDTAPCKDDTTNWIVSTLKEKITEQALLEAAEEQEMEVLQGQRQRYEAVLRFSDGQTKKEEQWQEWLEAWRVLREEEIQIEEDIVKELDKRMELIAYVRHAINGCFSGTCSKMKMDGFIHKKTGIPFEEMAEMEGSSGGGGGAGTSNFYEDQARVRYDGRSVVARQIVDSVLVQAAAHRFYYHMHQTLGRPHGIWLSRRRGPIGSADFDTVFEKYLDRKFQRRGGIGNNNTSSFIQIFADFDKLIDEKSTSLVDDGRELWQERDEDATADEVVATEQGEKLPVTENGDGAASEAPKGESEENKAAGATDEKSPEIGDGGEGAHHHHSDEEQEDDGHVIYKRKTSWSKLEKDEGNHD